MMGKEMKREEVSNSNDLSNICRDRQKMEIY